MRQTNPQNGRIFGRRRLMLRSGRGKLLGVSSDEVRITDQKNSGCALCSQLASAQPFPLWSDDSSIAWLSGERAVRGHSVLALGRHVEHLSEMTGAEQSSFFGAMARLERALLDVIESDRVLLVKLGLAVPHLHIHFYPVDGATTRDDVVAVIERRRRIEMTDEEMEQLAAELRGRLR
jgi:histidine triad (HIT) family protein